LFIWLGNGVTLCRPCHKRLHLALGGFTPLEIRLLRAIKKTWIKAGSPGTFPEFYQTKMNHVIEGLKNNLKQE